MFGRPVVIFPIKVEEASTRDYKVGTLIRFGIVNALY